jgi:hypothetical protein
MFWIDAHRSREHGALQRSWPPAGSTTSGKD